MLVIFVSYTTYSYFLIAKVTRKNDNAKKLERKLKTISKRVEYNISCGHNL